MTKMITIALLVASQAFAGDDVGNLDTGIACNMTYIQSSPLSIAGSTASAGWLVDGSEMESSAVRSDGQGGWGDTPANFLKVSTVTEAGKKFWKISVLDADKNLMRTFTFPVSSPSAGAGAKMTLPADAYRENESEDPANFDILEVVCENTIFVG